MEHTYDARRTAIASPALRLRPERGYLRVFRAKGGDLRPGRRGRAFDSSSNSWSTPATARRWPIRRAPKLKWTWEFVQFTRLAGMVWPPSVRGSW